MVTTFKCAFCGKTLAIPPHGDREAAMRPHLRSCSGLQGLSATTEDRVMNWTSDADYSDVLAQLHSRGRGIDAQLPEE